MSKPLVSIIIATFNSEHILAKVLDSLVAQSISKNKIEILIVDGGSSDSTVKIAKKYGSKIIQNPKRDPINAKFLGFNAAHGKYLVFTDHDEVLENKKSIELKLKAIEALPEVFVVVSSGYINPKGYAVINKYINEFGDPFSFFIYRLSKDKEYFYKTMLKRYKRLKENREYAIFDLSGHKSVALFELVAGSTMINAEKIKKEFPQTMTDVFSLGQSYAFVLSKYPKLGFTFNDGLIHYSASSFKAYKNKIKWRIKNNIFYTDSMGKAAYLGRESLQGAGTKIKKYIYPFYVFSLLPVLIDTIWLIWSRKNISYFMHFPLSLYTASCIMYYYILKLLKLKPESIGYDGVRTKKL